MDTRTVIEYFEKPGAQSFCKLSLCGMIIFLSWVTLDKEIDTADDQVVKDVEIKLYLVGAVSTPESLNELKDLVDQGLAIRDEALRGLAESGVKTTADSAPLVQIVRQFVDCGGYQFSTKVALSSEIISLYVKLDRPVKGRTTKKVGEMRFSKRQYAWEYRLSNEKVWSKSGTKDECYLDIRQWYSKMQTEPKD